LRKTIAVIVLAAALVGTLAGCAPSAPKTVNHSESASDSKARTARAEKLYSAEAKRLGCTLDSGSWSEQVRLKYSIFTTDCSYRGALVSLKLYSSVAILETLNPKSVDGQVWGSTQYTDGPIILSTPGYIDSVAKTLQADK
jgi:hypothetical protein